MSTRRMAYNFAHYLGVTVGASETIYLMGVGIKSLNASPSPKYESVGYIHEKNANGVVTGYENSFDVDYDDITDDNAVAALMAVQREQKTGVDAEFNYYKVDLLDRVGSTGTVYNAKKYKVVCEAGDETNEAQGIVSSSATLHQSGDFVAGTFDTSTLAFTPAA